MYQFAVETIHVYAYCTSISYNTGKSALPNIFA